MAPYLPQSGAGGGGSPYSEGCALYALGLIHANHGGDIKQFLRDSLCSTNVEVIQHGTCLGLVSEAVNFVRNQLQQHGDVQALGRGALDRCSQDNVSIIIVDLGRTDWQSLPRSERNFCL
ncbi:unnamed protein product [Camellia sinensis]